MYHDDFDPTDYLSDLLPDYHEANPRWVRRALLVAAALVLAGLSTLAYCLIIL
ncbi:hypothetical protein LJ737_19735 [Hymenobacter sp. 15J16-1T3B]|uniref:hypothetical protein n=1 Tax=Hymenobacter sp. 15J16-1T3B TaxID=2886941 RepID=UPI001D12A3E5|nr:hypothetical protein [Hymenobacter sp. 15J16-1T3B]MCC3159483.1 hypothetical protein [Hymenobacter sp. 15J16-1T3B]